MRLDFNILLIDDEIGKRTTKKEFDKLKNAISKQIETKGFTSHFEELKSIDNFELTPRQCTPKRVDIVISDNNLGSKKTDNSISNDENNNDNDGINFYLSLKDKLICDFVLYTKSSKKEIINKLSTELVNTGDPNLFSRFTFVSKRSDNWHQPILDLINHILSKREEINNLRGLYAQLTAQMHNHFKYVLNKQNERFDFDQCIDLAYTNKKIDINLKKFLHRQRQIRNGLLHNNEEFCNIKKEYKIKYEYNNRVHYLYEAEFDAERKKLILVYNQVLQLVK